MTDTEQKTSQPEIRQEILPIFTALFIAGMAMSAAFPSELWPVAFTLSLLFLFLGIFKFSVKYCFLFLALSAVSAGFFNGMARVPQTEMPENMQLLSDAAGTLKGRFKNGLQYSRAGKTSFTMSDAVFSDDHQEIQIPGTVRCIFADTDITPEPEQYYRLEGTMHIENSRKIPVFNGESLMPEDSSPFIGKYADRVQECIKSSLKSVLPPRHAAIITGFILGDTTQIKKEDKQLFRETGISHLMAVSGQHILVLVVFLAAVLHWLKIPPISRTLLISILLIAYAFITSGTASVCRALVMYLCVALITHVEAVYAPERSISLAALLLLLYDPSNIGNPAFLLSFTAVTGLILFTGPIEELLKRIHLPNSLARYLGMAFAANIVSIPLCACLFGTLSLVSVIVNPAILWSFSYILPMSFILALLAVIWPGAAILTAPALTLLIDGIIRFLEYAARIPGHYIFTGNLPPVLTVLCYVLMLGGLTFWQKHKLASEPAEETDTVSNKAVFKLEIKTPEPVPVEKTAPVKILPKKEEPVSVRLKSLVKEQDAVKKLDELLSLIPRRSLKGGAQQNEERILDVTLLSIENQTLYYQITDLDMKCLENEPHRVYQAYVYLMALLGVEVLNRAVFHLNPPPTPSDLRIPLIVKDRFLAAALCADQLLFSPLIARGSNEGFIRLAFSGQKLFSRSCSLLCRLLENIDTEPDLSEYFAFRREMFKWCQEFVTFDCETRKKVSK